MRAQGPMSTQLLDYLDAFGTRYAAVVFFSYLYATTYFGLPIVEDRAILAPLAHDEWPLTFSLWDRFFARPCVVRVRQRRGARDRAAPLPRAGHRRSGGRDGDHAARRRVGGALSRADRHPRAVRALSRAHRSRQRLRRAAGGLRALSRGVRGAAAPRPDRRAAHGDRAAAGRGGARSRRRAHEVGRDRRVRRVRHAVTVREPLDRRAGGVGARPSRAGQRALRNAGRPVPPRGGRPLVRQRG